MGVDFFNPHGDANVGPESNPESGFYFDDPEPDPESRFYFDDPDPDPDYDDDDPDPYSDDDPDLDHEFVSNSDPRSRLRLPTPVPTQAQIPIRVPTKLVSYASSAAQIMTSRLMTPTHGLDCAYCGDLRHTCETCFKLHGYPDWWATLKDQGQCNTTSNEMIDHLEFGARDYSLWKSDQSPIHSDQLPDPPNPWEDISDPSLTPTDNTEEQDEDPL
ncbi:hypothetical protein L3X38_012292 [Prunus dulcis]|uniref:Uncharacterized protein n=1 Tax=Prunus dulcis TaxID=3755 RepID=A0AAD4WJ60_PRUDU|nr:hypothetical protein L3X38_012292 [Prunus dulcis]